MIRYTRIRRHLGLGAAALVVMTGSALAGGRGGSAGALGQTTGAVRGSTSSTSSGPSSSAGSSSSSSSSSTGDTYYYQDDYSRAYCPTCTYAPSGPPPAGPPGSRTSLPTRVMLDMSVQSVENSDGAAFGSLELRKGRVGFDLSTGRYFERNRLDTGPETIYMDLWSIALAIRGFESGATEVWFDGGIGGAASNDFENMNGITAGARLEHAFNQTLGFTGSARYYLLEQDMRGRELRVAVSASYVSLGYRAFRFNVGPVLHGPEFGLHLRF